jgi:hypothetical protein
MAMPFFPSVDRSRNPGEPGLAAVRKACVDTNVPSTGATVPDPGNVVRLPSPASSGAARGWPSPWMPNLVERSDFLLCTRTRRISAPPELLWLAAIAIALGMPNRLRRHWGGRDGD